jgi:hypothetical protein
MTRRDFLAGSALAVAAPRLSATTRPAHATQRSGFRQGIYVGTAEGPIELIAYADRLSFGQLRMSFGSFEDVPAFQRMPRVLCNLPNWKPVLVWMSTRQIFRNEFAERRNLPFAVRPLDIAAIDIRIQGMDDEDRLRKLWRDVRASESNPAYMFVTMTTGQVIREYMAELAIEPG